MQHFFFPLSIRSKTDGKTKELQPHPYFNKKHFFAGTLPGYSDFDEHIISAYKMDISWNYITNVRHGMAFVNSN